MLPSVLEVANVSKAFGRQPVRRGTLKSLFSRFALPQQKSAPSVPLFWALREISFSVKRGEVLGIIGPNGAGKSTLLKLIAGVMRPTTGTIRVEGQVVSILELGLGFQQDLTGLDNILFNGQLHGLGRKQIETLAQPILSFAELHEFAHEPLKNYSSGMQMRLAFSIATHIQGDILIFDEVFGVGDESFRSKTFQKLEELVKQDRTILLVSHNLNEIASLCTRVLILEKGLIHDQGTAYEMVEKYAEDTLLRRLQMEDHSDSSLPITEQIDNVPAESKNSSTAPEPDSSAQEDGLASRLGRSWSKAPNREHDYPRIDILSVSVTPLVGDVPAIDFYSDCKLRFSVTFEVKQPLDNCDIVFVLRKPSLMPSVILHSGLDDSFNRVMEVGTHTVEVMLSDNLLNKGFWVIDIIFDFMADKDFLLVENIIGFRMKPTSSAPVMRTMELPSGVIPVLKWEKRN